jgi:hypothetical protein
MHVRPAVFMYVGVSKSFRTDRLERELQMIELSATRCSCIAILWVSLVMFAAITHCVASQRVCIAVTVYFIIDSVRKLLDIPSFSRYKCISLCPVSYVRDPWQATSLCWQSYCGVQEYTALLLFRRLMHRIETRYKLNCGSVRSYLMFCYACHITYGLSWCVLCTSCRHHVLLKFVHFLLVL